VDEEERSKFCKTCASRSGSIGMSWRLLRHHEVISYLSTVWLTLLEKLIGVL